VNLNSPDTKAWDHSWALDWETIWSSEYLGRWSELCAQDSSANPSPFFHPAVVRVWLESAGGERAYDPFFLTTTMANGFTAFLPLVRRRSSWKQGRIRILQPAVGHLADYHDPIFVGGSDSMIASFWRELTNVLRERAGDWFDKLSLPRVRHPAPPEPWSKSDTAPYLDLHRYSDFRNFFATRKKSLRSDLGRQMKRLSASGEIELKVYRPGAEARVLAWIEKLEAERNARYPASVIPRGYLRGLVEQTGLRAPLHCSTLNVGGRDISWHVGFCNRDVLYWYLPAYDSSAAEFSPGKLHLRYILEWAFGNGCRVVDFLRGAEHYKHVWSDGLQFETYRWEMISRTSQSGMRVAVADFANRLNRLAKR
jgi:CelD/BcsL family acetyltransferase involved in cellulose biosynthesis